MTNTTLRSLLRVAVMGVALTQLHIYAAPTISEMLGPDIANRTVNFHSSSGERVEMDRKEVFLLLAEKTGIDYIVPERTLKGKVAMPVGPLTIGKAYEELFGNELQMHKDESGIFYIRPKGQTPLSQIITPGTKAFEDMLKNVPLGNLNIKSQGTPATELIGLLAGRLKLPKPTGQSQELLTINLKQKPIQTVLQTTLKVAGLKLEAKDTDSLELKPAH